MEEIGKKYYYETNGGTVKQAKLVRKTKAWLIFDNGDWLARYMPLYETKEELENVNQIVEEMYKNTPCPDVVHLPNAFSNIQM